MHKAIWQENVSLRDWTTFKVGGPARYFVSIESEEDLPGVFGKAREIGCPVFIVGGGSNLLVPDKGYSGLVIQMAIKSAEWQDDTVEVGSGVSLSWLVKESVRRGLAGLEWEAAVPGTVGGAVCGNAGTPDHSIGQLVKEVRFFNQNNLEFEKFSAEECCFDYRDSVFRREPGRIVTSVVLKEEADEPAEIFRRLHDLAERRAATQPRSYPSAGCVFKNLPGQSAGALIDQAGLKGHRVGDAQISDQHANFIVNLGRAKSSHIRDLIELARERVKAEFGVDLAEEIVFLPDGE